MPPPPQPLPIDPLVPLVLETLASAGSVVIQAAPGAGKTTRVPPALLSQVEGEVLVLEPRRIAARMAARRVAAELGEELGQTVGYTVRFEEVAGPGTRLRFVTEGVLTRRLVSDPDLQGVGAVILDEFHERHLDGDLALALLKRLQTRRPQLRVVVMSATLDAAPIAAFLSGCPVLLSQGRAFPVEVRHLPYSPQPLEEQIAGAVRTLLVGGERGHILAFLPGAAEIRRAERACAALARQGLLVLPLHGDLSPAEQDRVVAAGREQKLVLATNIAESSLTIDGVTAVVDSGLARIAAHSPWTGLPSLEVARISQASAVQRAGRAGRTAPGRVLRLYPEEDFKLRRPFDTPEILRSDLASLCLTLRSLGVEGAEELDWLDAPPAEARRAAERLLDQLGAHAGASARALARFPLPPRLARVLVEAQARGVAREAADAVALLSSGARPTRSDLVEALEGPQDPRTVQVAAQLRRMLYPARAKPADGQAKELALLQSMLAGFGDRVARRRGSTLLLASGSSAELSGAPPSYEFLLALDAETRSDRPLPLVRTYARIEPAWLLDLFPDRIREQHRLEWNRTAERVESVSAMLFDEMVLQEWREPPKDAEAAAALLAEKAFEAGLSRLADEEAVALLEQRFAFAGLPAPNLPAVVRGLALGLRSFAELRSVLAERLLPTVEAEGGSRLRELAPTTVRLASGRQVKVHYEAGKPPWIASRLQDFFGMKETPRVGPERQPVVVHLLAPNHRAVQTTTDLAGFWTRLYPEVRRELMRRYPRHAWPAEV